jgi:hypothetical protein
MGMRKCMCDFKFSPKKIEHSIEKKLIFIFLNFFVFTWRICRIIINFFSLVVSICILKGVIGY